MVLFSNKNNLVLMESNNSGKKFLVFNDKKKKISAKLLADLITNMYKLKNHLVSNIDKFPDFRDSIELLNKNFTEARTIIYENPPTSDYTSYSVNKGEKVVFCIRSKEDDKLEDLNTLMFVAIHELAHVMTKSIGHTPEFWSNMRYLLKKGIKLGVYKAVDYKTKPVPYCGTTITDSPL